MKASLNFSSKIHSESEEVSIIKVVPYLKYFSAIFYLRFLELKKDLLWSNQFDCKYENDIVLLGPGPISSSPGRPAITPTRPPLRGPLLLRPAPASAVPGCYWLSWPCPPQLHGLADSQDRTPSLPLSQLVARLAPAPTQSPSMPPFLPPWCCQC
jgi:hypothetical protein